MLFDYGWARAYDETARKGAVARPDARGARWRLPSKVYNQE